MKNKIDRRTFIKTSSAVGSAAAVLPNALLSNSEKKTVKIGFIGTGLRVPM